jgi:cell wall-associated NlpC family hydrolase
MLEVPSVLRRSNILTGRPLEGVNFGIRRLGAVIVSLFAVLAVSVAVLIGGGSSVAGAADNPVANTATKALELLAARVPAGTFNQAVVKAPPPQPPQKGINAPLAAAIRIAGEATPLEGEVTDPSVPAPEAPPVTEPVAPPAATYEDIRWQLAQLVAPKAGVDAAGLDQVWSQTDARRMTVVLTGLSKVGSPYRWGASGPDRFDCSGFVGFAWRAVGVSLPRSSSQIIRAVAPRDPSNLLPGDLIWRPGHIGMYLGLGEAMVHSPQSGETVSVTPWRRASKWGSPV